MTEPQSPAEIPPVRRPVPCVGAIVWRGDEVLLIRRGKPPRMGEWSIPGGRMEFGEMMRFACQREVREETGCEIEIMALCDVIDSATEGFHAVLIDFNARWVSGEPVGGDDALEARFVALDDVKKFVTWPETLRVIKLSAQQMGIPSA
jgi:8-oxo-dGTP diphosphatase